MKGTRGDVLNSGVLSVIRQEVLKARGGDFKRVRVGKINNTEVIGLLPMEAASVREKDMLILQEIEYEALIVLDMEFLDIKTGEDVKRGFGTNRGQAGNLVDRVKDDLTLLVDTAARLDQLFRVFQAGKSGGD